MKKIITHWHNPIYPKKICKWCKHEFMPTSNKQLYCKEVHGAYWRRKNDIHTKKVYLAGKKRYMQRHKDKWNNYQNVRAKEFRKKAREAIEFMETHKAFA